MSPTSKPDDPAFTEKSPLHQPGLHESARGHVTGQARYIDDAPCEPGELQVYPVVSPHAHATIVRRDGSKALAMSGVEAVLFAADIPGLNQIGAVALDEPLLAEDEVHCVGQAVALVVATSFEGAQAAAAAVEIEYTSLPAQRLLGEAIEQQDFIGEALCIERGELEAAFEAAPHQLEGELDSPGQDHFYLETHAARARPGEGHTLHLESSTQHPAECQAKVAELLGLTRAQVVVVCPRMGGGFGGKESQAAWVAGYAALAAAHTGRPARCRLDRALDMLMTGKRHPWRSRYRVAFDPQGRLLAFDVETFAVAGWSLDLSIAILQRCLFHLDNAYFIPTLRYRGRAVRLNLPSNTAFRGFGGPQGMVVIESALDRIAETLGLDPAQVRVANLYGVHGNETPWGQPVEHNRLPRIWEELSRSADYAQRREAIAAFNQQHRRIKRGLAFLPLRFGISFTTPFLNQAGALLLLYGDGSAQLNHGGTEMGQGLHSKMRAICAHELGLPLAKVRLMDTATDKVPNTSATAASSGSDLNGEAVRKACELLRARLRPVAAKLLGCEAEAAARLRFEQGEVRLPAAEDSGTDTGADKPAGRAVSLAKVCEQAVLDRVSLSAAGYYATPGLHFDWETGRGKAFHYFAFGGAVSEVEVNGLTGEWRLRAVDILHDAGDSLMPTLDRGQIEGGFVQGLGWLGREELCWNDEGRLLTVGPSTYKIPSAGDVPAHFKVQLLQHAPAPGVIHGSKAVGEPPLMLALSVVGALRQAIAGFGPSLTPATTPALGDRSATLALRLPATPESVLRAIEAVQG